MKKFTKEQQVLMRDVLQVSSQKYKRILETRKPLGCFLHIDEEVGFPVFYAIDNRTNGIRKKCFTELEKAIEWLKA